MTPSSSRSLRPVFLLLALASLALAWFSMARISAEDPWYRNTDMNIHNLADALSLNSGYELGIVDQPAAPTKFLLALDYRLRNAAGMLPTWTMKRFARSPDPLREIANLVRIGRVHSRILVIVFVLVAAAYVGQVTRRFDLACFAAVLLCSSSGLLFHGLLVRPEMLCAGFGGVLAPYALWLGTTRAGPVGRALWVGCAGVFLGLALLSKLPAVFYVGLALGWCAVAPFLSAGDQRPTEGPSPGWTIGLCLTIGLATLLMSQRVSPLEAMLNPIGTARLRTLAAVVALMPLVSLVDTRGGFAGYVVGRGLEVALIGAGILGSLVGWFGLLHAILPADAAAAYMAKILNTTIYPDPLIKLFTLPGESHRLQEAAKFFAETPVLFTATSLLGLVVACLRPVSWRLRMLILFLVAQSCGLVFMMSKRLFLEQYGVFVQVPLLLVWALAFAAWEQWWQARDRSPAPRWPVALGISAAAMLVLTAPLAVYPKYQNFQSDAEIPVRDLTITFLYDHDAHPPAYLAAMRKLYPTREAFAAELNKFLSDPANRR